MLDKFSQDWFQDAIQSDFKGLVDLMDSLFEPRFSVSQLGISRQELLNWRKQEIFPFDSTTEEKRAWVKVNFFDYCLIRLVAELRKMNMPLDTIKVVVAKFTHVDETLIRSYLAESAAAVDDIQLDPLIAQADLKSYMLNPTQLLLDGFRKYFVPFNLRVISLMFYEMTANLLINSKGDIYILNPALIKTIEFTPDEINFLNNPYISIPLHSIVDEFYTNPRIGFADQKKILQLTRQETAILALLKKEGFKEIKIRLNKQRKGELIIELTEQKKIPSDEARIKSLLKKGKYQNIQLLTENGHIVLYEETTKFKI